MDFNFEAPDGSKETVTRLTDSNGIATLASWKLAHAPGRYAVRAVTRGWGPVTFTVLVPGDVVATYELRSINGASIPFDAAWGAYAHFVLYEGGLFNWFSRTPVRGFTIAPGIVGEYTRLAPDRIEFQFACVGSLRCVPEGAWGTVTGDEMVVQSFDFIGTQVYVRRLATIL